MSPRSTLPPLRVIVVARDPILRAGLESLLASQPGVRVSATLESLSVAKRTDLPSPAVCLIDIDDALPAYPAILGELARFTTVAPIVALTAHRDAVALHEVLTHGACACVSKDSLLEELVAALHSAAAGRLFLSETLTRAIVAQDGGGGIGNLREEELMLGRITAREREVLQRIAQGLSNKVSARDLGLSVKTVEKHRSNMMRKLKLHNTAAVTMFALRHGLVGDPDGRTPG
ncbi:MAG: response regulator transcription factor [Gammaproteobacteria bacterium]|nr:response regulator transcription factor [Gammaproteobacteria bacterium]